MSFDHWRERMLVTYVPLLLEYWNCGIDILLLSFILKRDIVILSRCPNTACYASKSYFKELRKLNNGFVTRLYNNDPIELLDEGRPIYIPSHASGDINCSKPLMFKHYGYLEMKGTQCVSPSQSISLPRNIFSPESFFQQNQHKTY